MGTNNQSYICDTGHCCGQSQCCNYYYELWCKSLPPGGSVALQGAPGHVSAHWEMVDWAMFLTLLEEVLQVETVAGF